MKPSSLLPPPELSRPLKVERVPVGGIEERIVATPVERAELAKRFKILEVSRFEALLNVDRAEGQMLAVTGRISADVVQECVVTLEPVPERINESIDVLFAPPHLVNKDHDGPLGDLVDVEPPESIENGSIDLGELAAQHLAMALNPYPRKEGAVLGTLEVTGKTEATKEPNLSPFAKLIK